MKEILILIMFFSFTGIKAQIDCGQDSAKYIIAYNFIINDSINQEKSIAVSDSIVDLDRFWTQELQDFPKEQQKLKQYRKNKGFIWSDPFYSPCLAKLFSPKNECANNVLFFSTIEDNMLIVDLLPYTEQFDKFNYDNMAFINTGRTYLFIFCKNGSIRAVFNNEWLGL